MGSGIPKSSAGNPVGYRNPGEKFYFLIKPIKFLFFRGFPFDDVILNSEDGTRLHGYWN